MEKQAGKKRQRRKENEEEGENMQPNLADNYNRMVGKTKGRM